MGRLWAFQTAKGLEKMSKRVEFKVSLEQPAGATIEDIRDYIDTAITTWWGQLRPPGSYDDNDPGDPLWYLDETTVRVTRLRKGGK